MGTGGATTKCTPVPAAPAKSPRLGDAIGRAAPSRWRGGAPHPGSAARLAAAVGGGATGTVGTTHAGSGRRPGAWRSGGEAERLNQRRLRRVEGAGCGGAQPGRGAWASREGEPGGEAGPLGDAERAGAWGSGHGREGIREAGTGDWPWRTNEGQALNLSARLWHSGRDGTLANSDCARVGLCVHNRHGFVVALVSYSS